MDHAEEQKEDDDATIVDRMRQQLVDEFGHLDNMGSCITGSCITGSCTTGSCTAAMGGTRIYCPAWRPTSGLCGVGGLCCECNRRVCPEHLARESSGGNGAAVSKGNAQIQWL